MIKYVLIKIEEITPELEAMQSAEVSVRETVKYTFMDGIYGVLMFDEVPNGYIGMTESEAREYIKQQSIEI